jgi:hypothetical protein
MNELAQHLNTHYQNLWENLSPQVKNWIQLLPPNGLQSALLAAIQSKTDQQIRILLLENFAEREQLATQQAPQAPLYQGIPPAIQVLSDEHSRSGSIFWFFAGFVVLICMAYFAFGSIIIDFLNLDMDLPLAGSMIRLPVNADSEESNQPKQTSLNITNGQTECLNGQLITLTNNYPDPWLTLNEDGKIVIGKIPSLANKAQGFCLSDIEAWSSFIETENGDSTNGVILAKAICQKTGGPAGNSKECLDEVIKALYGPQVIEISNLMGDEVYPYQPGLLHLPTWDGQRAVLPTQSLPATSNSGSGNGNAPLSGDPNVGGGQSEPTASSVESSPSANEAGDQAPLEEVVQTPYPTFTPTPNTVEEAKAVEQGESNDGPQELGDISMSDLISRSALVWSKPGVDSVEIRRHENGNSTTWIAWAPSYATAEYYMWIWDTKVLSNKASQAGCSSFVLEGAIVYEIKVANQLTFTKNDGAGVAKYMFPANQTSIFGCYVWPTNTPPPSPPPTATVPPAASTSTPVPTATPQQLSGCHVNISWNSLISNPGQVTGSGNSYLTKWNQIDDTYVGNATEQAIFYCITNRPATINGTAWNQQLISLTGQQYGGSGECNIEGTNVWVASCWE